jgi:hypothetical protein
MTVPYSVPSGRDTFHSPWTNSLTNGANRIGTQTLAARDAAAPDLGSVLNLVTPTNIGPPRLKALPYAPAPATAAVAQTKSLNSNQRALVGLAANLPQIPGANLQAHLAKLRATGPKLAPAAALVSVHDARDFVKRQAGNYFRGR